MNYKLYVIASWVVYADSLYEWECIVHSSRLESLPLKNQVFGEETTDESKYRQFKWYLFKHIPGYIQVLYPVIDT